jgi:hypothetical protein
VADRSLRAAVISQLVVAIYLQTVEWIDLFPWNNVAKGNRQEVLDVVLLVIQAGVIWAFLRRTLWAMALGWGFYAVWLWLQVVTWWKPYLLGGAAWDPTGGLRGRTSSCRRSISVQCPTPIMSSSR